MTSTETLRSLTGRLDEVTTFAVRALAEDPTLSSEDARRERERIVGERRRQQTAERARRKAAVEALTVDVAAAMRQA